MTRPPSIVRFEQFYWGSIVLGWINAATQWSTAQAAFGANPLLANATWLLPALTIVSAVIAILVWYFIARAASVVAKWVQVVFAAFAAFAVLSALYALTAGGPAPLSATLVGVAANLLYIAAATMLFRADAREWFGEDVAEPEA